SFNIGPKTARFSSFMAPPDGIRPPGFADVPASPKLTDRSTRGAPGLAWRPLQGPASQQVQVHVEDRLPRVAPAVHHHPVPALPVAALLGDLGGGDEEVADLLAVLQRQVVDAGDVLERDEQDVDRGRRPDVLEAQAQLV